MVDLITSTAANLADDCSEKIADTIETFIETSASGFLKKLESWTGIPSHFLMTGCTIIFLILFMFSSGPFFILNILLALYPAYKSFQVLQAKDQEKCFEWMKFWIVFAVFHGVENIGDRMVWWMPGYGILKFVFLLWCFAPVKHNGSTFVYGYIHTILSNNAETLEKLGQKVHDVYKKVL